MSAVLKLAIATETAARNRADVAPGTLEEVGDGLPGTLKIYKIGCSEFWYARAWINGQMVRKSTGTTIRTEARKEAKKLYKNWLIKSLTNEPLTDSPNFKIISEALFKYDQDRVNRAKAEGKNKPAQSVVDDAKYIYNKDLVKFFGKMHCRDITYQKLLDYQDFIKEAREGRELSTKTVKNHYMVLRKILTHALRLKEIETLPSFPPLTIEDNPRGYFTADEFNVVTQTINKHIKAQTKVDKQIITEDLLLLVLFAANGLLRTPDLYALKWKHIQAHKFENGIPTLKLLRTKKAKRGHTIGTAEIMVPYKRIKERNAPHTNPEDYVFWPIYKRSTAVSYIGAQFRFILQEANLYYFLDDGKKQTRDLYSCRHSMIMRLRRAGKTVSDIAVMAGTSDEMIQRHYASHLTAEMIASRVFDQEQIKPVDPTKISERELESLEDESPKTKTRQLKDSNQEVSYA
jgi:Phage integrase SAM-like domain